MNRLDNKYQVHLLQMHRLQHFLLMLTDLSCNLLSKRETWFYICDSVEWRTQTRRRLESHDISNEMLKKWKISLRLCSKCTQGWSAWARNSWQLILMNVLLLFSILQKIFFVVIVIIVLIFAILHVRYEPTTYFHFCPLAKKKQSSLINTSTFTDANVMWNLCHSLHFQFVRINFPFLYF